LGSVASRERRSLWATLSFLLAIGVGASAFLAHAERDGAVRRATKVAEDQAEVLSGMLTARQLSDPVTGPDYAHLADKVRRAIMSKGPIDHLTVFSSRGRIVFDTDRALVGETPSAMQDLISPSAVGSGQSRVQGDVLQTFVPVTRNAGGSIAVAQMDQPVAPVDAQVSSVWGTLRMVLTVAFAVPTFLLALTFLPGLKQRLRRPQEPAGAAPTAEEAPLPPERPSREEPSPNRSSPAYMHPGFQEIERARQDAEERAKASDANFHSIRIQFERALEQVKTLGAQVASQDYLRRQLRDVEARANAAEGRIKELQAELQRTSHAAGSANSHA
jgi:hypothetical protein